MDENHLMTTVIPQGLPELNRVIVASATVLVRDEKPAMALDDADL